TKVAILEGIGAEAGGELERDGAHALDEEVALRRVDQARRRVALDRGGEDRQVEARRLDVLAERVAPRSPGVAELEGKRQPAHGVEADERARLAAVAEADVRDLEVAVGAPPRQRRERRRLDRFAEDLLGEPARPLAAEDALELGQVRRGVVDAGAHEAVLP